MRLTIEYGENEHITIEDQEPAKGTYPGQQIHRFFNLAERLAISYSSAIADSFNDGKAAYIAENIQPDISEFEDFSTP